MIPPAASLPRRLRTWLVLARISNLPTVWSNCFAAWILAGAGTARGLTLLIAGASLLYTGGMFLNDACDSSYDARHRPGRPIPAGHISRRAVYAWAAALLLLGWSGLAVLGFKPMAWGAGLAAAIVAYNLVHKHNAAAPLLMAGCRFLLYCAAAAATSTSIVSPVLRPGLALASYIAGLSFLARGESENGNCARAWPLALICLPAAIHLGAGFPAALVDAVPLAVWLGWTCATLLQAGRGSGRNLSRAVPGLLAGIALLDWALVPQGFPAYLPLFPVLFVLSLALQRSVPPT